MKLNRIRISNFRSIEQEDFEVEEKHGGYTYTLIGINESGKSSFLRAISLIDLGEAEYPKDFNDSGEPIEVRLSYTVEASDERVLKGELENLGFAKELISQVQISAVDILAVCQSGQNEIVRSDVITFAKVLHPDYTMVDGKPVKKDPALEQPDFDIGDFFVKKMGRYFWKRAHRVTFWKSDTRHLVNDQIDLEKFSAKPDDVSVPLKNCFALAGFDDIPSEIAKIKSNPADINNLQERLGDKVTAHIKKVWPDHPIRIKFQINNMKLSFLVEDDTVRYSAKMTDQRSDGFRQFVSFLLTISAESVTDQLANSLLLLDEPETHLHPKAQEYLRDELIKITGKKENNLVFFATHSNYMIDKKVMDRCYRVYKKGNKRTKLEQISHRGSSYSEVNYEVFEIASSDYHNELYGFLEDENPDALHAIAKTKKWKNKRSGAIEDVSLSRFIRHSIHHPENDLNDGFTPEELEGSIKQMRLLKYGKDAPGGR